MNKPPATQAFHQDSRHQEAEQTNTSRSSTSQMRQSTLVRPHQPHIYGTRINRALGRIESTLCRCPDPNSHGDAFTLDSPYGTSLAGQPLTYQQGWTALLDYYGKDAISDLEVRAAEKYVLDQATVERAERQYRLYEEGVRLGASLELRPNLAVTYYNGDGHSQPHITEDGLRTRMDRSGYSRRE